jgi:5-methylcytosine-specific restriction enzyme A
MPLYACQVCGRPSPDRRCPAHRKGPRRSRPSSTERGYDRRWRNFRAEQLEHRPICEHPDGCERPAVDLHHLDGLGPNGPRGFDPTNVQPLCHPHRSRVTMGGRAGDRGVAFRS